MIQIAVQSVQRLRRGTLEKTGDQGMNETCDRGKKQSRRKTTGCHEVLEIGFVNVRWMGQKDSIEKLIHDAA